MLNPPERAVVDKLAEAWNLFLKLPEEHPMDKHEFATAIHRAQNIVMARPAAPARSKDRNPDQP